jgi:hypothetical protein
LAAVKVPVPLDVQAIDVKLEADEPAVIFTAPDVAQVVIGVPATAVDGTIASTLVVLFEEVTLPQAVPEAILLMIMLVVPAFSTGVVKVPVPGVPAVKTTVALIDAAKVAPVSI